MEDLVLRRQPYSAEAEQSVLGSLLIDPACISEAIEIVSADDFYIPENKKIFETMTSMYTLGQMIDPVILLDELKSRGYLLAVLSNKKNKFVQPIIAEIFGDETSPRIPGQFNDVAGVEA